MDKLLEVTNEGKYVTQDELSNSTKKNELLLIGVVIVMFVGFVSILVSSMSPIIDAWRFRASSYVDLSNKINEQSNKIDFMDKNIMELKSTCSNNHQSSIMNPIICQ